MRAAVIIFIMAITISGVGMGAERDPIAEFYDSLAGALLDMGMTPEDFRIRHDYAEPDVFRLPLVDSLMHDPASLLARMDELAGRVEESPSLDACALTLWDAMSVEPDRPGPAGDGVPTIKDVAGRLSHLSAPLRKAIEAHIASLARMDRHREDAIAGVTSHLTFLYDNMPRLLAPSPEYEAVGPFEAGGGPQRFGTPRAGGC